MKKKFNWKTIVALTMLGVLFSGFGLAAWKLGLQGNGVTGMATSQKGGVMMVQKDFDDINILETTNHSQSFNTWAEIKNNNGVMNFTLNITEIRNDVEDECIDYEDDVTIDYTWNNIVVNDGDTVELNSGINVLNMTANAVMQTCPQDLIVNWALV